MTCPDCKTECRPPARFGLDVTCVCAGCGAVLDSNQNWLIALTVVLSFPLIIWSAQHWPMFTFIIGDWLILGFVALVVCVPFQRVTAVRADKQE